MPFVKTPSAAAAAAAAAAAPPGCPLGVLAPMLKLGMVGDGSEGAGRCRLGHEVSALPEPPSGSCRRLRIRVPWQRRPSERPVAVAAIPEEREAALYLGG